MPRKHISLIAFVLVLCISTGVLFSVRVSAASAPSLFHNDEKWYKDSTACLEVIDDILYIPVDIFGMFSQIELSMDSRKGEFMLFNRTTGRYISVLYGEKIATVDGVEEIYLNLYKLHGGYYYVPAEYFCSVMDLYCEIRESSAVSAGKTLRICDGTETKTMTDLLQLYDPSAGVSDTSQPPVTRPPTPPVTSDQDHTERTIYLTFNTISERYIADILETLRLSSVQATFFLTEEELAAYPSLVNSIVLDGHTLALTCSDTTDAADFLTRMDEANELLYGIAKVKTRIVQLPGGTADSGLTETDVDAILAEGYILWDYTYDVPDSAGYMSYAVKNYTVAAVRREDVNVLRMSTNATVAKILPDLLSDFLADENYHVVSIVSSSREVRKS